MTKQKVSVVLAEVFLKSGRTFDVMLGTGSVNFDLNTFTKSSIHGFSSVDGKSRYIVSGESIDFIKTREGEIEIDAPDPAPSKDVPTV